MTILKNVAVLVLSLCAVQTTLANTISMPINGNAEHKIINRGAYTKKPSVLPPGARLVAGNSQRNEFYILGKVDMEPGSVASPKEEPVLKTAKQRAKGKSHSAHHVHATAKHKAHRVTLASKHKGRPVRVAAKRKVVRIASAE